MADSGPHPPAQGNPPAPSVPDSIEVSVPLLSRMLETMTKVERQNGLIMQALDKIQAEMATMQVTTGGLKTDYVNLKEQLTTSVADLKTSIAGLDMRLSELVGEVVVGQV